MAWPVPIVMIVRSGISNIYVSGSTFSRIPCRDYSNVTVLSMIAASSMTYCYNVKNKEKCKNALTLSRPRAYKHRTAKSLEGVKVKIHVPYILTQRESGV